MTGLRAVGIRGTGGYVPERVLTNDDLSRMVDTNDEWITTRTGIKERRISAPEQATSHLAIQAARKALERAELHPREIDLIIVATVTGDFPFPSTACLVQHALGCERAGAFDLAAACSGFLYGMSVGSAQIRSGAAKHVLLIGAESLSRVTDYTDRSSCILFGDGAGAVVLSAEFERGEVLDTRVCADGSRADVIQVKAGGSALPLTPELLTANDHLMRIRGREVYKFAVSRFVELVQEQIDQFPQYELGMVVPHQVNLRIIESARSKLNLTEDQVYVNIDRYGNTSAASIPIALDEVVRAGKLDAQVGKMVIFCAFGAGLTWASGSLRW